MWRPLLAFLYALLLALALQPLGAYNDARAPLFWQVVLARIPAKALPPSLLCDLQDRAQLPRDQTICGGGAAARGAGVATPVQPAP